LGLAIVNAIEGDIMQNHEQKKEEGEKPRFYG
jgi:hypothetical protein